METPTETSTETSTEIVVETSTEIPTEMSTEIVVEMPDRVKAERVAPDIKGALPSGSVKQQDQAMAAAAKGPRVSLSGMEKKIAAQTFYKHDHLTICVLEMSNGFFVVGKSAPASIENFDEKVGCDLAYQDCIKQLWAFEGYALKEKMYAENQA